MAKNTKTPVMVLQELTVKKGYPPPNYELVYCLQGTHENEFHYKVCVQGQHATGVGRSKKEAKHEAARKVLELLDDEGILRANERKDFHDIQADHTNVKTPENCIPTLMDLCAEYKIPPPEFTEISAVGLAHCREFTYECKIASVTTRSTAGSKKHAKQYAAKDMLQRITSILPDLQEEYEQKLMELCENDTEVVDKYNNLKQIPVKMNLNIKVTEYEYQFREPKRERKITNDELLKYFALPHSPETLEQLLQLFDYKFYIEVMQDDPSIVYVHVNSEIPLTVMELANTLEEASQLAIEGMFSVLKSFMLLEC